jgi:hypothetical protein
MGNLQVICSTSCGPSIPSYVATRGRPFETPFADGLLFFVMHVKSRAPCGSSGSASQRTEHRKPLTKDV